MGKWNPIPSGGGGGAGSLLSSHTHGLAAKTQTVDDAWEDWGTALVITDPGVAVHALLNVVGFAGTTSATAGHVYCQIRTSADGGTTWTDHPYAGASLWHDVRGQYQNMAFGIGVDITPTADIHIKVRTHRNTDTANVLWAGDLAGTGPGRLTASVFAAP